jgi:CO/xanthine dehydrogenase FAD-binding subunit
MLKQLTQFYRPSSIEEASSLLAIKEKKNVALAGGTHLAELEDVSIDGLVDLSRLDLAYIRRTESGYAIGAMTPVQDISKSGVFAGPAGSLLQAAAGKIGSTLLRHSITIGGNIYAVFPWSDLPPVLLALDAEVLLRKGAPKRTVAIGSLYEVNPRTFIDPAELIVEIKIPEYGANTGTAFTKFSKTANDYALISVAVRLTLNAGQIVQARVAVNGTVKRPMRLSEVEQALTGQRPSAELMAQAASRINPNLDITTDFRASKEYRLEVLGVLVRRCLEEAAQKIRG